MINIEKLDNLPKFEGGKYRCGEDRYYRGRGYNHKVRAGYPRYIALMLANHYISKTFDQAFSHYCLLVKKYQQDKFLELFRDSRYWKADYYLDSDGKICKRVREKKKRKYSVTSPDYKTDTLYKGTSSKHKEVKSHLWAFSKYKKYVDSKDYETIVVSGFSWQFEEKCGEYYKLKSEVEKAWKKINKAKKQQEKEKAYNFLTNNELKNKANQLDIIKRDAHGFNEESFIIRKKYD